MTNSPEPAQAPLLLAELCCHDLPREMWGRALLRVRQVGAEAISIPVWYEARQQISAAAQPNGSPRFPHYLAAFVQECAQVGIPVILDLQSQEHLPALRDVPLGSHGAPPTRDRMTVPRWIEECSAAFLDSQAPGGPVIALHLGPEQAGLDTWLRDKGWGIPIQFGARYEVMRQAHHPVAALLSQIGYVDHLIGAGVPVLHPAERRAPALLRSDGSARPAFWQAKAPRMLIGTAMRDYAVARAPADLALVGNDDTERLARQLAAAGIAFDWYEPGAADPGILARYVLVLGASEAQEQIGADELDPLSEQIEARGGHARYAWADSPEIEAGVRYGAHLTYLFVYNRRASAYNGMLTYRAPAGDVLHLHIGIGAGRTGMVALRDDEVVGAAIDGDGAEGGWLARGLTSSMVFNAGAGSVAPCGNALLVTAPQSGRFQLRRSDGWESMLVYRLLLSGEILPGRMQIDAAHVILPYTAEDERGQTDLYILLPASRILPAELREYLAVPLRARAADLRYAAELAGQVASELVPLLDQAARALVAGTQHLATIDDYASAWQAADPPIQTVLAALERAAGPLSGRIRGLLMPQI